MRLICLTCQNSPSLPPLGASAQSRLDFKRLPCCHLGQTLECLSHLNLDFKKRVGASGQVSHGFCVPKIETSQGICWPAQGCGLHLSPTPHPTPGRGQGWGPPDSWPAKQVLVFEAASVGRSQMSTSELTDGLGCSKKASGCLYPSHRGLLPRPASPEQLHTEGV